MNSINAAEPYDQDSKTLLQKATEKSQSCWQDEYWGAVKFPPEQKVYSGRNCHYATLMYWGFMDRKYNGNEQSLKNALSHYDYIVKHFWDADKKIFRTDYDFLMNASIALSLGYALHDAADVIPPAYQQDFREKLKGIAAFLPAHTTALKKTNFDLRANNQEAFSCLALALIAGELKDEKIKQDALVKFRSVLTIVQQSFWIEGGVDIGYQSVGEPAFMAASNLLWDNLSRSEKKQVADLLLCNRVGNGYGIENCRSSSWIKSESSRIFNSDSLARVGNPFVADDAEKLFMDTVASGFPSTWWLHDPASLSFFSGFIRNRANIAAMPKISDRFAWGSLACHSMEFDEAQQRFSGTEKAYLTGFGGITAIFGDLSHINATQAKAKFGNDMAPRSWNSGGLRYLGWNGHFYLWPDDTLGCQRLNSGTPNAIPQMVSRRMYPGFGASEYSLTQVLPGYDTRPPVFVQQNFAAIDRFMVAVFISHQSLKGISFDLTLPVTGFKKQVNGILVQQKALDNDGTPSLQIIGLNCAEPQVDKDKWKTYFKEQLSVNNKRVSPPDRLSRIAVPFRDTQAAALIFVPMKSGEKGDIVKNFNLKTDNDILSLEMSANGISYVMLTALNPMKTLSYTAANKREIKMATPEPGFLQIFAFAANNSVVALTVNGRELNIDGKEWFTGEKPAMLSMKTLKDNGVIMEVAGAIRLSTTCGTSALSLIDNRKIVLPGQIDIDRLWIKK